LGERKNQANLTLAEKRAFVNAILELKRRPSQLTPTTASRYDDYVKIHQDAMPQDAMQPHGHWAHRGPAFLPWHRVFLHMFESDLQAIDPAVALPYWNWTTDNSPTSSIWSSDFMGGTGRREDGRVMDGPFAFDRENWTLRISTDRSPDLKRRLGIPIQIGSMRIQGPLPSSEEVEYCIDSPYGVGDAWPRYESYDTSPWNINSQSSFRNRLEGFIRPWLHNRVHNWVAGQAMNQQVGSMFHRTSPNDPVFWLHHCFVDLIWVRWQFVWGQTIGGAKYYPTGMPPDVGPTGHNLNDAMQPFEASRTPANVLRHHDLGYWYDVDPFV
jgi:tyrosinase